MKKKKYIVPEIELEEIEDDLLRNKWSTDDGHSGTEIGDDDEVEEGDPWEEAT